ncbi:MAG: hypothetical protein KGS61_08490 [Verrucomicrobia bacterium]|nr:hypothetical protein [Verrucomicrobiota bacterium]
MRHIRSAAREEVVAHYIASELNRVVEHADAGEVPDAAFLGLPASPSEGALQHMSRVLLCDLRKHSWLYDQFWARVGRWSLVKLRPDEIDVMPIGGPADKWHYPKLDAFVRDLQAAANAGVPIPNLPDDPAYLLQLRPELALKRIILIKGDYAGRMFEYAIGDGAHRAVALAVNGVAELDAYWGIQYGSESH